MPITLPFTRAELVGDKFPLITVHSSDGHLLWHFRIEIGGVDATADE
jgi:hypothetical protein